MKKLLFLLPIMFLLSACVQTPVVNQTNLNNVDFEKLLNQKVVKSCVYLIFGVLPLGHASVAEAAWKAGIKKVSYVEIENGYFPLLNHSCVIVYGE